MELEIILNKGKTEGMVKGEIKLEGIKSERELSEIPTSKVTEAVRYFCRELDKLWFKRLVSLSFVRGDINQVVYKRIIKDISEQIPYINAHNN